MKTRKNITNQKNERQSDVVLECLARLLARQAARQVISEAPKGQVQEPSQFSSNPKLNTGGKYG
jgi:hypothetical protein